MSQLQPVTREVCGKTGRDLLGAIAGKHPRLVSFLLSQVGHTIDQLGKVLIKNICPLLIIIGIFIYRLVFIFSKRFPFPRGIPGNRTSKRYGNFFCATPPHRHVIISRVPSSRISIGALPGKRTNSRYQITFTSPWQPSQ